MAVLVQTLIDQIRVLSNLKNNLFYSDDDIGGFVNDAALELDDIFTGAVEHYSQASLDFTLAGGVGFNGVSLLLATPAFMKAQVLLKDPLTSNPTRVDPLPNMAERGGGEGVPGLGRCYLIGGDNLEILPASSAAGDYRLLYTPQLGNVWPAPADFTVRVLAQAALPSALLTGGPGPGKTATASANGVLPAVDGVSLAVGDRIGDVTGVMLASTVLCGIWRVVSLGSVGTPWVLTRATDYDTASAAEVHQGASIKATAGTVGTNTTWLLTAFSGAVDVVVQTYGLSTTTAALPTRLMPWQLFIKVHAAIAIRQGRQQPTGDLVEKMAEQRKRVTAASANRTEGVTQAPLQRRTGGRWNDPIPGGTW